MTALLTRIGYCGRTASRDAGSGPTTCSGWPITMSCARAGMPVGKKEANRSQTYENYEISTEGEVSLDRQKVQCALKGHPPASIVPAPISYLLSPILQNDQPGPRPRTEDRELRTSLRHAAMIPGAGRKLGHHTRQHPEPGKGENISLQSSRSD